MARDRVFVGESLDLDRLERTLQSLVRRVNKVASVYVPAIPISFGYVALPTNDDRTLVCRCVIPSKGKITKIIYKGTIPEKSKPVIIVEAEDSLGKKVIELFMKAGLVEGLLNVQVDSATIVTVYLSEQLSEFSAAVLFEPFVEEGKIKSIVFDSILSEVNQ